jgi:predicted nucleic acid-binding protein
MKFILDTNVVSELRKSAAAKPIPTWFDGRRASVDTAVAQRSAMLHVPNPQPLRASLIAATALVHGMTVVTRNIAEFRAAAVQLLNPWH